LTKSLLKERKKKAQLYHVQFLVRSIVFILKYPNCMTLLGVPIDICWPCSITKICLYI